MKKLRLKDGNFHVAVLNNSTVIGEDIISRGDFYLYAEQSKVRIKGSSFGVGRLSDTSDRFVRPGDTEFRNCTFTTRPGLQDSKNGLNQWAVIHVHWNVGDSKLKGQTLRFEECAFNTDGIGTHRAYAFHVEPDQTTGTNTLLIRNCTIAPRFDVPFEILGGRPRVENER